jgi:hypothetical protein
MTILYILLILAGLGVIGCFNYRHSRNTARWLQRLFTNR